MAKINIFKRKDNGENKYTLNLPKEVMESLAVGKGDELMFIGELGGEIRFKLRRKSEIDYQRIKKAEAELKLLRSTKKIENGIKKE